MKAELLNHEVAILMRLYNEGELMGEILLQNQKGDSFRFSLRYLEGLGLIELTMNATWILSEKGLDFCKTTKPE